MLFIFLIRKAYFSADSLLLISLRNSWAVGLSGSRGVRQVFAKGVDIHKGKG
jgi:hypothetical protein